ncbi:YARHG domain-containing protein [Ruminococcus gauvreauii]|uniref:YARHG domain-containing protein n=1 Tax=Ruminococcus gauvreauii TaxID=438033 RepID=A0ABY5VKC6_9FIRM|nr:YARHG domain-containing protein [Ruminococcus gauvreauii]UWP60676.1 YARHG domain-containing protein [Ruminococcus gauvreauii]
MMKKKMARGILAVMAVVMMTPAAAFAESVYVLKDSGDKKISERELSGLSAEELRTARNEIMARHGFIFDSPDMKEYFEQQSWYQPSAAYEDSALSETEQENIELIHRSELKKRQERAVEKFEENQRIAAKGDVQPMSSSWVYMESPCYFEELRGKWVDDSDPTYPDILEFWKEDGIYRYRYYSVVPGNGNGLGIGVTETAFEYCAGTFSLNSEEGYINCYVGNGDKIYKSFVYDVMSDTLVEASMDSNRPSFVKNNDFTYR